MWKEPEEAYDCDDKQKWKRKHISNNMQEGVKGKDLHPVTKVPVSLEE